MSTMRTYTADGRLHISRSHISKACVNPYFGREIPDAEPLGLDPDRVYYLLRDPDELAKAAATFKILPILNKHILIKDFDGMEEQEKKKYIVGSTGSDVEFLDPYLDSDVCIWENEAIVGIETDKVREFSCSYRYVPVMSSGKYQGVHYDGIMTQIHGNHLMLCESGRAGSDVLAADKRLEIAPMKRTKLGNALITAITTAWPKVEVAQDSALEKVLGAATRKGFVKKPAIDLILAMDADVDEKQVDAVMDALVDVEDPEPKKSPAKDKKTAKDAEAEHPKGCMCADCKEDRATANDEEDEEEDEDEKKRKEAKDKRAKDKAKDAASKDDVKGAMDSLETKLRAQFRDAEEAKRDVRDVVGDLVAMDSAEAIYDFALDHLKVDRKDVDGLGSKRALFRLAKQKSIVEPVHVAMDSTTLSQFPNASRFRVM